MHQQSDDVNPDSHSTTFFGDLYPDMKGTKASSSLKPRMPVEFETGFAYNIRKPELKHVNTTLGYAAAASGSRVSQLHDSGERATSGHHPSRHVCWMSWAPLKVERERLGFSTLPYLVVSYLLYIVTHLWARMGTEISVFEFGI